MTNKLDVNVTKEAIERNFISLNTALTNYDKQLTALQKSATDTSLSDEAKAELTTLIDKYKTEINTYINNAVAGISFDLNDYQCAYANITAKEYVNFKIIDNLKAEKSRFYYNTGTGTWQISYNGANPSDIVKKMENLASGAVYKYRDVATYDNNAAGVLTGTLKITLPVSWSNTMLRIKIVGYDYNAVGGAWELTVSGYNFSDTGAWMNTSIDVSNYAPFSSVRFAHDGTKCCILLGTTATTWVYPKIAIAEVLAGFGNQTAFLSGWTIELIADETGVTTSAAPIIRQTVTKAESLVNGLMYKYRDVVAYNNNGNITGTLKITLPVSWSNTMLRVKFAGYNYSATGGAWELTVSGYNYSDADVSTWINVSADASSYAPFSFVRFAHDGTKCCILLGTTTTVWGFPKIVIPEVVTGYDNRAAFSSGWAMEIITNEVGITTSAIPTIRRPIGDMLKSVYDVNSNGKVDVAETAEAVTFIDLTTPPTNGQTLVFNTAVSKFQPSAGSSEHNVDGGAASSVYLALQLIDGGAAVG